jgi:hypothetical protein
MTWLKVDDKISGHMKVLKAGNAAFGAWVRMAAWCAERESDGVLPAEAAALYGNQEEIAALLRVGLLHTHPEGYEVHDFLKYNPSHAHMEAERARWAEKRGRDRRTVPRESSPVVAPGVTPSAAREQLHELPGTGTGSGSLDRGSADPDGDSQVRESAPRLKSIPPKAPEPEPEGETGYGLAKRVFCEEWEARKGRAYAWSSRTGKGSDDAAMLEVGRHARDRGGTRAEEFMRHWAKGYLRDAKALFADEGHPARFLTRDAANKYGEPPTGKHRVAAPARASPEPPPLTTSEQASRAALLAGNLGKIGMGGGR